MRQVIEYYRQACSLGLDFNLEVALDVSLRWGTWAMKRAAWEESAQAFGYGLQAIERLFRIQILRASKEAWLREAQRLPTYAAYAFARVGDYAAALRALEDGRVRLLADAIERDRSDLEQLSGTRHDESYRRYRAAVARVEYLEDAELRKGTPAPGFDVTAELKAARAGLDAAVAGVQQVPGYEDFFRSTTLEEVRRVLTTSAGGEAGAAVGIYLVVTSIGGLALIVYPGGIRPVWLEFKEDDLHGLLLKREADVLTGGYLFGQLSGMLVKEALDEILPVIGEKVVSPVLQALRGVFPGSAPSDTSDLILIPTGLLSLLPLHAARYCDADGEHYLLDQYRVSYTPSARALRHSQRQAGVREKKLSTFLGVGNPLPLPEGVPPLTFARTEVEEIAPLFPGFATLLVETEATLAAVEDRLNTATYLHFSCHGQFNVERPRTGWC